ncbi:Hydantoin racemase [[Leptolyngbya] sp. PCC 7376]|uniref:S-methyl thiohydantoin desulfurase domain-containing protein n=1 Tax=[Leptolyngbya] sp. PCC 7376 TaxID=111781 RepID=UPI00029ED8CA|nr:DUF917 family protein [[Leptolyngbya] sp. PCC 7376]AFY40595.1 Hydantoin racemase [[Leptolyngbya] sp. PCC 7376]
MFEQHGLDTESNGQQLKVGDIKNIVQGACFLASGGGGSLQLALTKIIPHFFDETTEINLINLETLTSKNDWGAVVAGIGSPLELFRKPDLVKATIPAYKNLAKLCFDFKAAGEDRYQSLERMSFCLPVEIGAVNSIVPMVVANGLSTDSSTQFSSISVVDADGAGRAVPTLPLTTYARQIGRYPNILGGDNETEPGSNYFDYASLNVQDETTLETATLGLVESKAFGLVSGLAIYAANGPTFQNCKPIRNSMSDALQIGIIINQKTGKDRLQDVLHYINNTVKRTAKQAFYGQVTFMEQATEGLDTGLVQITGAGTFAGEYLTIFIENENIWCQKTTEPDQQKNPDKAWIVGPDSMNYLTDEGHVFDNSDLWSIYQWMMFQNQTGPTVSLIAVQAAEEVRANQELMDAWSQEVQSKGGPKDYTTPWLSNQPIEKTSKMKIRVIAPIASSAFNPSVEAEIKTVAAPDADISLVNLDHGTKSIESRYDEFLNTADIIKKSQEAQQEGMDGIFIDCFADPGLGVVRELVDIPAIGGFEPAVLMAKLICQKFSIVTVEKRVNSIIEDEARKLGIMSNLMSIRDLGIPVVDLGNKERVKEALLKQSQQAIEQDGAQAIVLGCTGMLEVAKETEKVLAELGTPAPVIDPTTAAITTLQALVRMNLSQSRLEYYKPESQDTSGPKASTIKSWSFH